MTRADKVLKDLYEALEQSVEVHPHLLECKGCSASIHQSNLGSAMSEARFYLATLEE